MNSLSVFEGLGSNLLSEAIGIIITVLFVDVLIKRRESKRWEQANRIVSFRLSAISHTLIYNILEAVRRKHIGEEQTIKVPLTVQNIGNYIATEGKHMESFDLGILQMFKNMIADILPVCTTGVEPDILTNLLLLDRGLEIPLYYKTYDLKDMLSRQEFLAQLRYISVFAANIAKQTALHGETRKLIEIESFSLQLTGLNDTSKIKIDELDHLKVPATDKGIYKD